nr:hypothetical protein [Tanacetum cinerariifolium]
DGSLVGILLGGVRSGGSSSGSSGDVNPRHRRCCRSHDVRDAVIVGGWNTLVTTGGGSMVDGDSSSSGVGDACGGGGDFRSDGIGGAIIRGGDFGTWFKVQVVGAIS